MAKVQITFEFDAESLDDARRQASWFVRRRTLPSHISITSITADGDNILTTELIRRRDES